MSTRVGGPKAPVIPAKLPEVTKNNPAATLASWSEDSLGRAASLDRLQLNPAPAPLQSDAPTISAAEAIRGAAPATPARLLRVGSRGEDVRQLQRQLGIPADGIFGNQTLAALRAFQSANGLKVDGVAGPQTFAALQGRQAPQQPQTSGQTGTTGQTDTTGQTGTTTGPTDTTGTTGTTGTTATTDAAEREALARRLVVARGTATQADVDAVVSEIAKMPLADLRTMERAGISVYACRDSVADGLPRLANEQPRGWPPGSTWQQVPGAYSPSDKAVVIATRAGPGGGREVFPTGARHGSVSLAAHEAGHAVDAARGYESRSDRDFIAAYDSDLARGNMADYYTQAGDAGRSEAYAESYAYFVSGDPNGRGAAQFPALMEYWRQRYGGQ